MSDTSGLEMNGLSEGMEAFCGTTYRAFLQEHGIPSWPVTVTVIQKEPIPGHPQQYEMHMKCGVQGTTFSLGVTTNPETDLRTHAGRSEHPHSAYGFPSSSHMFRDLIPKLSDRFHVIAPDYIGFGFSAQPAAREFKYTFDNLTSYVEKLLFGNLHELS
jgi:alpha/beta hydrolase fold